MIQNSSDLIPFLGISENDLQFREFLMLLDSPPPPRRESQDDHTAYIQLPQAGLSVALEDEIALKELDRPIGGLLILVAIQLYCKGYQGYEQFSGRLPNNLQFSDSKYAARAKLGEPTKTGGGVKLRGRVVPAWDEFAFPAYLLHLTYDDGPIKLLSIIAPVKRGQ